MPIEFPGVDSARSCPALGLALEQLFHFVGIGHFAQLFGELLVLGEERPCRGDGFFDIAEDVFVRVEMGLLFQEADGEAFGELGLAVEVLVDAGHDPQQRAFAGAVATEHADFRARVEREPDIFEDFALTNLLGQAFHLKDVLLGHVRCFCCQVVCVLMLGIQVYQLVSGPSTATPPLWFWVLRTPYN